MIALMRLTNLDLHNFRCYVDLSLRLDPATVIIGPNDAGKSTILDAIRCLLTKTDRNGQRFERRTVATMRELDLFLVYDEGEAELLPEDPVTVVGTFGDLSEDELRAWEPVVVDGQVRIGVLFPAYGVARQRRCLDGGSGRADVRPAGRAPLCGWSPELGGRERALMGARWVPMYGLSLGSLPEFVFVPGPDVAPPAPAEYLGPVVDAAARRVAARLPEELLDTLVAEVGEATDAISAALTRVVPRYVPSTRRAALWQGEPLHGPESMSDDARRSLVEHLIGSIDVMIERTNAPSDGRPEISGALGAGARRSIALASLELFRDPDVWPANRPVLVVIEEPEVGLHPSAQRTVAASLRGLPTYGVQTVVVTHSPAILNAAARSGIRVAAPRPDREGRVRYDVVEPTGLQEAVDAVGATAADLLLGSRFIVVEGESDREAMRVWAAKLGIDFEAAGVNFFPAGSYSMAGIVAKLLEVAYGPIRVRVVLDGGSDTEREAAKLRRTFGDRVEIDVLAEPEIERYFTSAAVGHWLAARGLNLDRVRSRLAELETRPVTKSYLNQLHREEFGSSYSVTQGARAIASFMTSDELAGIAPHLYAMLSAPD